MAAVLTPADLTVLEHSALKHPSPIAEPTCPLPSLPTSLVWNAESNLIFISSADRGLLQYDPTTGSLQDIASNDHTTGPIVSLLSKDRGSTVIYGRGQRVVFLSTQSGKTAHTFDTHKATITSLSLSNDSTLLASTSAHAIHVHNLTLASHTVLRGLSTGSDSVSTCAFHSHSRTRLLVGYGTQLLVYDTTRPSGPSKIILVDKDQKNVGSITAITCSPFSKTLVAVACAGGAVILVDLEKEKSVFRVVTMPAPLTCLAFSAEGAALYAGTENGKFLILDLRALDKSPKTVSVSENGDQVIAISIQRKLKAGEAQATKPLVQRDTNKAAPVAHRAGSSTDAAKKPSEAKVSMKPKPGALSSTSSTTPKRATYRSASNPTRANGSPATRTGPTARRVNGGAAKSPVAARGETQKKAFSPARSPVMFNDKEDPEEDDGDLSVRIENLLALPKAKEASATATDAPASAAQHRATSALSRASSRAQINNVTRPRTHTRTESASRVSVAESQSASAALPRIRSASSGSIASRASKASTRASSGTSSASPPAAQRRRVSGSSALSRPSRTPSPDLPEMEGNDAPVTPIPAYKVKGKERTARGLGTPEVDEWVKAGDSDGARKGGERVGFASDSDSEPEEIVRINCNSDEEHDAATVPLAVRRPREPELAMQVSPRRSYPGPSPARARTSWAPVPSPLRPAAAPPSPQARAAQDMLQALLRDAMHDFRQETKAEIVGLHLDLIRMGTSWRSDMREAMGEFAEELSALREENRRLREENERLRRGY